MPDPIKFGEWAPDQADVENPATEAKGVVSVAGQSYGPFPALVDYNGSSAATSGICLGGKNITENTAGDAVIFLGDGTKLYTMLSRVVTDISKAGGYTLGLDDSWQFAQFGDYVIAVAPLTAPQAYQLGVSALFANLGGSPPNLTSIARVGDFMMGGLGTTVYWSAFNDHDDWVASPATQAGSQVLDQTDGLIKAIAGLDYAAIFQERGIRRAIYVGPPLIWDFGQQAVETRRGAISGAGVAAWGRNIFYVADDGFYVFDGQSSTPIGHGKVDDYFQRNVNYGYRHKIAAAIDSKRKLVVFGFPTGSATNITELLIYAIQDGRWTHDLVNLEFLFDTVIEPFTVDNFHLFEPSDDLDTVNLDSITIDTNVADDERRYLAGVAQTNHRFGTFTGAARAATIETQEFEPAPGKRALVTELWPITDAQAAAVTAAVGYKRALPGATVAYTSATAMNAKGFCPQRIDARFARGRLSIASGAVWQRAIGMHYKARVSGGR